MRKVLTQLKEHLHRAPRMEVGQMFVRFLYWPVGVGYALAVGEWLDNPAVRMAFWVIMSLGLAHAVHLLVWPLRVTERRRVGVLIDQGAVIAFLGTGTGVMVPLMFMSATISVGYGLRFGSRWSVYSAIVAGIGLTGVALFNPAYRAAPYWSVAMVAVVALVPLYAAFLSARLERSQREIEAMAAKAHFDATHDGLTGLVNRDAFLAHLNETLDEIEGRRRTVGVLFIDLDRFKQVNDTFGHAAGDTLLCRVAECLRQSVRAGDLVGRLGGDEFVVMLKDVLRPEEITPLMLAMRERLRAAVATGPGSDLDASIGATVYTGTTPRRPAESLIAEADASMYRVKEQHKAGAAGDPESGVSVLQRAQVAAHG